MAAVLSTLFSFTSAEGPQGLAVDANGNLFGTTYDGGANNLGSIFELADTGGVYSGAPTTLVSFNGPRGVGGYTDGPAGAPILDASGNLFGVTQGTFSVNLGYGSVFEVPKVGGTYANAPTTLFTFDPTNGGVPIAGLVADANDDLFGATLGGAGGAHGSIFEITRAGAFVPLAELSGGMVSIFPTVSFIDSTGNIFGITQLGGIGDGDVFELMKTATGYASTPTTLASFNGSNGLEPESVIADGAGNLFGIAHGGATAAGLVFEIPKTAAGYGALTTLVTFSGIYSNPGALIVDAAGNLFGIGGNGGANGDGTIFEIAKTGTGYASAPTLLATFDGTNGASPVAALASDSSGDLFGMTSAGGSASQGTVFELTGSGFVPACYASGVRISTPTGERRVETLSPGDAVQTASGQVRPIAWVGHRDVDCAAHPDPQSVRPVRVRAHAFGPSLPKRDLFLSPDHAIFLDGVLIPVKHLIDGDAIAQVAARRVTYHHIELETHDLLLAEGLPAESYLDVGDRNSFAGGLTTRLHAAFGADRAAQRWDALGYAPLAISGPVVERIRARLASLGAATAVLKPATEGLITALRKRTS